MSHYAVVIDDEKKIWAAGCGRTEKEASNAAVQELRTAVGEDVDIGGYEVKSCTDDVYHLSATHLDFEWEIKDGVVTRRDIETPTTQVRLTVHRPRSLWVATLTDIQSGLTHAAFFRSSSDAAETAAWRYASRNKFLVVSFIRSEKEVS